MLGFGDPVQFIVNALYLIPGLLLGLVLHEAAHAAVAVGCGDETPRLDGRLTLDPSRHLDPFGTIAVFLLNFGWARPVRINPFRMRHRFDPALVAAAGPLTNLLIAIAISIPLRLAIASGAAASGNQVMDVVMRVMVEAFFLNILLAVFNLLPIPPLDGYNLFATLLRRRFIGFFSWIDQNQTVVMLVLFAAVFFIPGVRHAIFSPIETLAARYLLGLAI